MFLLTVYPVHYAPGPKYKGVSGKYIAEQSGPNNPGGAKGTFEVGTADFRSQSSSSRLLFGTTRYQTSPPLFTHWNESFHSFGSFT